MKILQIDAAALTKYQAYVASAGKAPEKCAKSREVSLSIEQKDVLRRYECMVRLVPTEGTGILIVQSEQNETLRFLLDAPVCVCAGVWHSVLPYHCDLKYCVYAPSECQMRQMPHDIPASGMAPQTAVTNIYSVLYQQKNLKSSARGFTHFYWELTYVDHGSLNCDVEDGNYVLRQGDLIFFTPYQHHRLYCTGKEPVSYFTVTFDVNSPDFLALGKRVVRSDTVVRHLVKEMLSEYNMDLLFFNEAIASNLLSLLIHVYRSLKGSFKAGTVLTDGCDVENPTVLNCLSIIEENIPHKISAEFIAEKLYISPSQLRKLFKEEMGISISEYIRNRKLEKARYMILRGNYTITQISDMLEYCSVCYFSSEFKKKYGVRPCDYEKSIASAAERT